ncbi:MAG: phosphatase PAP2 family protein [Candidatus Cloacimonadaceae bacterium]|jgi:lipid A 4'-phosphatase
MREDGNMAAPRTRHNILLLDFIVPGLILLAGTILLRFSGWDLKVSSWFYLGNNKWWGQLNPFCNFMYYYGTIPALLLSIISLVILILSFFYHTLKKWRRNCIYLVLVMIIGPGLLVNIVLKENWGRPRPRNIIYFGGNYVYEKPLEIDSSSPGKSFPSGHAAMGFYFFTLYFLVRGKRGKLTIWAFLFAVFYGLLMGFVRIAQGGHFLSDILWSGGIIYLCSAFCYYLLKINQN